MRDEIGEEHVDADHLPRGRRRNRGRRAGRVRSGDGAGPRSRRLAAQPAPAAPLRLPVPPAENLVLLIRLSLLTLNDALQTGTTRCSATGQGADSSAANRGSAIARLRQAEVAGRRSRRRGNHDAAVDHGRSRRRGAASARQRAFPGTADADRVRPDVRAFRGAWKLYGLSVAAVPVRRQCRSSPGSAKSAAAKEPAPSRRLRRRRSRNKRPSRG